MDKHVDKHRVEVMKARDVPVSLLDRMFERSAFDILEWLPIGQLLAGMSVIRHGEGLYYPELVDDMAKVYITPSWWTVQEMQ